MACRGHAQVCVETHSCSRVLVIDEQSNTKTCLKMASTQPCKLHVRVCGQANSNNAPTQFEPMRTNGNNSDLTAQDGIHVDDVVLPPWALGSADEFVRLQR